MNTKTRQQVIDLAVCTHDQYFKTKLLKGELDAAYHLGVSMIAEKRLDDAIWLLKIAVDTDHAEAAHYLKLIDKPALRKNVHNEFNFTVVKERDDIRLK